MAVVNADYTSTVEAVRRVLGNGGALSQLELQTALAVVKDAASRMTTSNAAIELVRTAINMDATACAAAGGATAAAVLVTQRAALLTLEASIPTITTNAVADGTT